MTISIFLIQLTILLLPGVIWARIDASYGKKKNPSQFEFLLRAALFGIVSYAVTYVVFFVLHQDFIMVKLENIDKETVIDAAISLQIAIATLVGFILSIVWLYFVNYKIATRFLQLIRATKTYGDEDVWDFVMNSPKAASEYVHYRDFANNIVYAGWVGVFSESEKLRELVLNEAQVFDFDGNLLFELPSVYIARGSDNMHLEFPYKASKEADEDEEYDIKKPWLRQHE